MLREVISSIASVPWVYDQIQFLAGARSIYRRIAYEAATLAPGSLVLDLGGGTGLYRDAWAAAKTYMNIDLDMLKLRGSIRNTKDGNPILADGTCLPIKDSSVDVVMCVHVSHHLSDRALEEMIRESCRVLRVGGTLLLFDGVWVPRNCIGKLMWRYDRGSYPRTVEYLNSVISKQYSIALCERYTVYHVLVSVLIRGSKGALLTTSVE